jgi:hypothetical protein
MIGWYLSLADFKIKFQCNNRSFFICIFDWNNIHTDHINTYSFLMFKIVTFSNLQEKKCYKTNVREILITVFTSNVVNICLALFTYSTRSSQKWQSFIQSNVSSSTGVLERKRKNWDYFTYVKCYIV